MARETDHQRGLHTQRGKAGLHGKHHPYLRCLALCGLGLTVGFRLLIPKLHTEVLHQPSQHGHGFVFTLNQINPDTFRYRRYVPTQLTD